MKRRTKYIVTMDRDGTIHQTNTGLASNTKKPEMKFHLSIFVGTLEELDLEAESMIHFSGVNRGSDVFSVQGESLKQWVQS